MSTSKEIKIAFTICSNNYLAQAITLCDSLRIHAQKYEIIIVVCDTVHEEVLHKIPNYIRIVQIKELAIQEISLMVKQYNIIEFNTSVKASAFKYFYENFHASTVIYFDPDVQLFASIENIETELDDCSVLLTPHVLTPPPFDSLSPQESIFQKFGLYNLGFLATRSSQETMKMLQWWDMRLRTNCFIRPKKGVFVDQLPMNFSPIYFPNVKISKNFGFNVAPWNFHERNISFENDFFYVNGDVPLIFYHFSNFKPQILLSTSHPFNEYSRFTFDDNTDLYELYGYYHKKLMANNYDFFSALHPCFGGKDFYLEYKKEQRIYYFKCFIKKIFLQTKKIIEILCR